MPCFLPSEKLGGSLFFFFVMCCWSWCFRGRGAASRPSASLSSCIHSSYVIIILVFVFLLLDPGLLVFPSFTRMSGKSLCGRSYGRARFSFFFFPLLPLVLSVPGKERSCAWFCACVRKMLRKKKKKVHEKERTYLCKSSLSLTLVKPHELMIPGSKKGTRRLCDCCAASSSSHKRKEKRSPLHLSCAELDPTPVGAVFC